MDVNLPSEGPSQAVQLRSSRTVRRRSETELRTVDVSAMSDQIESASEQEKLAGQSRGRATI